MWFGSRILKKKLVPTLVSWQLDPENKLFLVETNLPSPFSGTMLIYWRLLTNIKADAIHILIIYSKFVAGGNFTGDLRTPPGHIMKQMCKSIVALAPSPRDRRFTKVRDPRAEPPNVDLLKMGDSQKHNLNTKSWSSMTTGWFGGTSMT